MHLEKIEIQGFKSFANKTTLIFPEPIKENKGITAIVGPNGSGKSNVVDAIRWVLGEQSLKTLRGKKSHDVIFHGAEGRSQLGMAEVTLFIDNKDKTIPIEYAELMLTRKLYRNGENEYLINKGKAKLSEIIMLLAKANFGQKSFSIVGQGMIDHILQAGFKERKEFFDEAVGVKQYQIKRNKTINDLRRTKINLDQIKITLKELEPRVKLLSRQAKKLEKRKELKKKLTDLQIRYYGNIFFSLEDKINEINSRLNNKKEIDKKIGEDLLGLQKKLAVFAKEHDRDETFNKLKEQFDILNSEKNLALKKLTILRGEINIEYKKRGQLDLAWITKNKDELEEQQNKTKKELENLKNEKEIAEKKSTNYKNNLIQANKKLEEIKKELEKISAIDTEKTNGQWEKLLGKIIKRQRELIIQINLAKDIKDFKAIKKIAEDIEKDLQKLRESNSKEDAERINIKISELSEKERNLIKTKNEIFQNTNQLEIKLSIIEEKIKMTNSNLRELKEKSDDIKKEIRQSQSTKSDIGLKEYKEREKKLKNVISEIEEKIKKVKNELDNFNRNEQEKKDKAFALQDEIQQQQIKINQSKNQINELMIELTKLETRKEGIEKEATEEIGDINQLKRDEADEKIDMQKIYRLKSQLELIGGIDPETMSEYKETKERYEFLTEQVDDLEKTGIKLEKIIDDLDKLIKNKFDESFSKINKNFNKYFKILFEGGDAKLIKTFREIKDEMDSPSEERASEDEYSQKKKKKIKQETGIEIQAAPQGKKLKDINILSGGERSLTSIALICAIISINPSPFVILDEVDAALDESNSVRFAEIIKNLSYKTQFITITHNRATMEAAKVLYGVTMQEKGVSKIISINLEDAKAGAAR